MPGTNTIVYNEHLYVATVKSLVTLGHVLLANINFSSKNLSMTFFPGATTVSITTLNIMTLCIKGLYVTLSISDSQKNK